MAQFPHDSRTRPWTDRPPDIYLARDGTEFDLLAIVFEVFHCCLLLLDRFHDRLHLALLLRLPVKIGLSNRVLHCLKSFLARMQMGSATVLAALLAPRNTRIAVTRITRWQSGIEAHFVVIPHLVAIGSE